MKYVIDNCYQVSSKSINLAACGWRNRKPSAISIILTTTIDPSIEYILLNKITIYKNNNTFQVFKEVMQEFDDIFTNYNNIIDILEE